MPGGLVVVDLKTGTAWRALSDRPSTQFDPSVIVEVDGKPLRRPDGRQPMFNADGIELSNDGRLRYWQALTGRTLYRISTSLLQQARDPKVAAALKPEVVGQTEPVDGLWKDKEDRIYLSAIGENAIKRLGADGKIETLVSDPRLRRPDTFSQGPDGLIYITASHIQDSPWFHQKGWTDKSFSLFSFRPDE